MHTSFLKIKSAFPSFNVRELTEDDWWEAVYRYDINVHHLDLKGNGYYHPWDVEITEGAQAGQIAVEHHIHMSDRIHGIQWLDTAYHELFHYLLHWPLWVAAEPERGSGVVVRRFQPNAKQELEARLLASIAQIPAWQLEFDHAAELDERQLPEWLLKRRARVMIIYGI